MAKKKTYTLDCTFCKTPFEYQASDGYHIRKIYCYLKKCYEKFMKQSEKERAEYIKRLKKTQKEAVPIGGKRKYVRRTGIKKVPLLPPLEKKGKEIFRVEDGTSLGIIVGRDKYRYCVSKAGNTVWYQKKSVSIPQKA